LVWQELLAVAVVHWNIAVTHLVIHEKACWNIGIREEDSSRVWYLLRIKEDVSFIHLNPIIMIVSSLVD